MKAAARKHVSENVLVVLSLPQDLSLTQIEERYGFSMGNELNKSISISESVNMNSFHI